jgi:hypothetical protein
MANSFGQMAEMKRASRRAIILRAAATCLFLVTSCGLSATPQTGRLNSASDGSRGAGPAVSPSSALGAPRPAPTATAQSGPVISAVRVAEIAPGNATISWRTDTPATSQVSHGPRPDHGASSTLDSTAVTNHSVFLGGLTPGSIVHYRVVSTDARGTTESPDQSFSTSPAPAAASAVGEWSPLFAWPLVDVHMSLLHTGEVLMWDAWEFGGTPSTRLWNPSTRAFTHVPTNMSQLFCSDQTALPDGRVLVTGGHNGADVGIKTVMIFDPKTSAWTRAADLHASRWYPISVALPNGHVLALGGEITLNVDANTPEEYDPAVDTWTQLPGATLDVGQYPHTFVLPDGRVFMDAGPDGRSRALDLATQTWAAFGINPAATGTSAMYRPGKILATGGGTNGGDPVQTLAATIDLTAAAPSWQVTAPMIYPRYKHSLVVLPDGSVLAVGGSTQYSLVSTVGVLAAEIWDPANGTWTRMADAHNLRMYHSTALLLPDGRVLVAGGGRLPPAIDYPTAEIYSPPYLFKGPRPTVLSAPAATSYGAAMRVQAPDAAQIGKVALIRLASITHAYDSDQRYVELRFSASSSELTIQSPANANIAPPGFYMLFVVNSVGVPSVARVIQIVQPARTTPTSPLPPNEAAR